MDTRSSKILSLRASILGQVFENSSIEEKFQNQTLRPILKFQNDIILEIFKRYITDFKGNFYQFKTEKKIKFIEESLQKDHKLRNLYKGIILGHFTVEELNQYHENKSSLNKRMNQLVIERLKSQIILFEMNITSE
jgi:hypothetical protein